MAYSKFFMRFYGDAAANIDACVAEMKAKFPTIKGHTVGPVSQSVNMHVPPGSKEVHLLFLRRADRDAVGQSQEGAAIYMKYCEPAALKGQGTFQLRQPGEPAWKV